MFTQCQDKEQDRTGEHKKLKQIARFNRFKPPSSSLYILTQIMSEIAKYQALKQNSNPIEETALFNREARRPNIFLNISNDLQK